MFGSEAWVLLGIVAIVAWAVTGTRCGSRSRSRRRHERNDYEKEIGVKDSQIRDLKKRVEVLERLRTAVAQPAQTRTQRVRERDRRQRLTDQGSQKTRRGPGTHRDRSASRFERTV